MRSACRGTSPGTGPPIDVPWGPAQPPRRGNGLGPEDWNTVESGLFGHGVIRVKKLLHNSALINVYWTITSRRMTSMVIQTSKS